MTIEIANRLVKLRKEKGLSQEELADKLGLSRQAVSKWERAEASPDTDNLICLAKLYGVSLDELLTSDDDIETIVKEQVKDKEEEDKEEDSTAEVKTDEHGKTIIVNDGKDKVVINIDKNVKSHIEHGIDLWKNNKLLKISGIIEGTLFICSIIAYVVLGTLVPTAWAWGWIILFVPEILASILRAIAKKQFKEFNMALLAVFSYFFFTMAMPMTIAPDWTALWHPLWVIFLAIPVYYIPASAIDRALGHDDEHLKVMKECCSNCCSEEDKDND